MNSLGAAAAAFCESGERCRGKRALERAARLVPCGDDPSERERERAPDEPQTPSLFFRGHVCGLCFAPRRATVQPLSIGAASYHRPVSWVLVYFFLLERSARIASIRSVVAEVVAPPTTLRTQAHLYRRWGEARIDILRRVAFSPAMKRRRHRRALYQVPRIDKYIT